MEKKAVLCDSTQRKMRLACQANTIQNVQYSNNIAMILFILGYWKSKSAI